MLVQSNGGKLYAVAANNENYELGILPTMQIASTSVFLMLRLRFKALNAEYFDPMMVPKSVLVSGIERSANTLRGHYALNTGFTVEKVGAGFPQLMAEKIVKHSQPFLPHGFGPNGEKPQEIVALYQDDLHEDFGKEMAQLIESVIAPIYPAKDFSEVPPMLTPFDLQIHMESAATKAPANPFAVHDGGKGADAPNVKKFPFGAGDPEQENPAASEPENQGA